MEGVGGRSEEVKRRRERESERGGGSWESTKLRVEERPRFFHLFSPPVSPALSTRSPSRSRPSGLAGALNELGGRAEWVARRKARTLPDGFLSPSALYAPFRRLQTMSSKSLCRWGRFRSESVARKRGKASKTDCCDGDDAPFRGPWRRPPGRREQDRTTTTEAQYERVSVPSKKTSTSDSDDFFFPFFLFTSFFRLPIVPHHPRRHLSPLGTVASSDNLIPM